MSKSSIESKYKKLEQDYEALGELRFIKFDFERYFTKPENIGEVLFEEWKEYSTRKELINYFPSIDRSLETFKRGIYNWQMACLLSNYPKTLKIEYSNTQTSVLEQAFMRGEAAAINYLTNDLGFLDENIRLKKRKDWKGLKDFLLYEMVIKIDGCEFNGANFVKSFIPKEGSIDTVYWIGYFTEIVTQCEIIEHRHFKPDSSSTETAVKTEDVTYYQGLTLPQLALYNWYLVGLLSEDQASGIIKLTKHKSVQKLRQYSSEYRDKKNRTHPRTESKKSYSTKERDFETVIEKLKKHGSDSAIKKAEEEFLEFKNYAKKFSNQL